jgi:hypothetical protein
MEPLWSPVVAAGGNRSQIARLRKSPNQAKTIAVGCDRLPGIPGTSVRLRSRVFGRFRLLRGFRASGFPRVPALPASLLDGTEGVDGSSLEEGFDRKTLQIGMLCCLP